jgi:hypothetical protein
MNKQLWVDLWQEMADHLQAALLAIETALLAGPNEALTLAQREALAAWETFETAARPYALGQGENGHVGPREGV